MIHFYYYFFFNNSSWLSEGNRLRIPLNNGQSQSLTFVLENKQILRLVAKGLQFIDLLVAGKRRLCVWNTNSKRVPGSEERRFQEPCTKLPSWSWSWSCAAPTPHNKPADDTRNHHLKWWGRGGEKSACIVAASRRDAHLGTSSLPRCFVSPRLPS